MIKKTFSPLRSYKSVVMYEFFVHSVHVPLGKTSDKATSDFDYIRQGDPMSYPYPGTRTATVPNGTKLSRYRSSNDEPTLSIDSPNRDKVIKVRY
jgi:hypothetical protein